MTKPKQLKYRIIQEGPIFYFEILIEHDFFIFKIPEWHRFPEHFETLEAAKTRGEFTAVVLEGMQNPKQVYP